MCRVSLDVCGNLLYSVFLGCWVDKAKLIWNQWRHRVGEKEHNSYVVRLVMVHVCIVV